MNQSGLSDRDATSSSTQCIDTRLLDYLIDEQLIASHQILNEGLTLVSTQRQRATSTIVRAGGHSIWRIKTAHTDQLACVQRETACYQRLSQHKLNLHGAAPNFVHSNKDGTLLITENLSPGMTMHEAVAISTQKKGQLLDDVARLLADIHCVSGVRAEKFDSIGTTQGIGKDSQKNCNRLSQSLPWMLMDLHADAGNTTKPDNHFWAFIAQHAPVDALLGMAQRCASAWLSHCLIHGDVKWDNVVLRSRGTGSMIADKPIALVDWELGGWGDSAWDVGTAIQELLLDNSQMGSSTIYSNTQQQVSHFLRTYRDGRSNEHIHGNKITIDHSASWDWLQRVVLFAGVRLMQSAYEFYALENRVGSRTRYALYLAQKVATSPDQFANEIGVYSDQT